MNINTQVAFRLSDVEIELQSNMIAVSDQKYALATKNAVNRLRTAKAFVTASEKSLLLIVQHSDIQTLDYLMNPSNYHTSERILDCANLLTGTGKYSSILTYFSNALKACENSSTARVDKKTNRAIVTVQDILNESGQCYSRISNAIKAFYLFDTIECENLTTNSQIKKIDRMSINTIIRSA